MNNPIPDYSECIVGWRGWNIGKYRNEPHLISPTVSAIWQPGVCMDGSHIYSAASHYCKGEECNCGVNAMREPLRVFEDGYISRKAVVLGEVALWGQVREFSHGFRADMGYPHRLWATRSKDAMVVEELCRMYWIEYGGIAKVKRPPLVSLYYRIYSFTQRVRRPSVLLGAIAFNMIVMLLTMLLSGFGVVKLETFASWSGVYNFGFWGLMLLIIGLDIFTHKRIRKNSAKCKVIFEPANPS